MYKIKFNNLRRRQNRSRPNFANPNKPKHVKCKSVFKGSFDRIPKLREKSKIELVIHYDPTGFDKLNRSNAFSIHTPVD